MELLKQQMRYDRAYWRSQSDRRLIEEARDSQHELCIALGERLEALEFDYEEQCEDLRERAADFERDANQLDDKVYELRVEIDKLEMQLTQREDEVAHLRDQLNNLKKETK